MLYLGPLRGELLNDNGRELIKRILTYPSMLILGVESLLPPRINVDHSMQEVQLSNPPEPARLILWQRGIPESIRAADLNLPSIARAFHLSPGEIIDTGAEAQELASLSPTGTINHDPVSYTHLTVDPPRPPASVPSSRPPRRGPSRAGS